MDQSIIEGVPGRYWHPLEDGRIQCDVCPRYCKLHEGQRGLCFVRARQDDRIVLTTYGRSSGFCIDPIEKKPLNHFLPGTPVLSFGTAGCNLTCKFCQNWDISKARALDRVQDLASPAAIAEAAVRSGCRSVAFTYNDPVIFLEYAVDVAQACRARGIKTVAVSAGYICAGTARSNSSGTWTPPTSTSRDSPRGSTRICARASSCPCSRRSNISSMRRDVWFEITTLLIPGENDSPAEIEAESRWVMEHLGPDVPLHFSRLSSGLEDAGHAADAAADAPHGAAHRDRGRSSLRLYRQHPRSPPARARIAMAAARCSSAATGMISRRGISPPRGRCADCGTPCAGRIRRRAWHWGRAASVGPGAGIRQVLIELPHRGMTARVTHAVFT